MKEIYHNNRSSIKDLPMFIVAKNMQPSSSTVKDKRYRIGYRDNNTTEQYRGCGKMGNIHPQLLTPLFRINMQYRTLRMTTNFH